MILGITKMLTFLRRLIFALFVVEILVVPNLTLANYFTLPASSSPVSAYFDHDQPGGGEVYFEGTSSFDYDDHNGTDFDGDFDEDILASADGTVGDVWWNNCGGWQMHVWHEGIGLSTLYSHIATTTIATTSDTVLRGDHIAEMSSTGSCATGAHLHFGVVDDEELSGNRIDPFGWQATTTDPWPYNQGYLWTTDPPSLSNLAKEVTGNITATSTWRGNYLINGTLTIDSGVKLTIEAGTIVKFKTNTSYLNVNGTLDIQGSTSLPVYITSYKDDTVGGDTNGDASASSPAIGDWREIKVNSGASATISNAVIRYGGRYNAGYGQANVFNNGGSVTIEDSEITKSDEHGVRNGTGTTTISGTELHNNGYYGLYVSGGSVSVNSSDFHNNDSYGFAVLNPGILSLTNSTFANHSLGSGVLNNFPPFSHSGNSATGTSPWGFVVEGSMSADRTWDADSIPYVPRGGAVAINSGTTLTMSAGAIVKPIDGSTYLNVSGTLDIQGSTSSPVYITSYKDDTAGGDTNGNGAATSPATGDWREIKINSGGSATIANAVIRYGGKYASSYGQANLFNNGGNVTVSDSEITQSNQHGIRNAAGTSTISGTEIHTNGYYGIQMSGGSLSVSDSSFHDNDTYGLVNSTAAVVAAEDNYWGHSSGPYHPVQNPSGTGQRVTDNVDFDPWLSTWP